MSVYYSPEDLGLESIASLDLDNEPYQFDIVAVWRHTETGRVYWATDSGCSCPSPFENFNKLEDFEELVRANYNELLCIVENALRPTSYGQCDVAEARSFLRAVNDVLVG